MPQLNRVRQALLVGLPYLAVAVAFTLLYVAWRHRLPEEVAIHFGSNMEADGFGAPEAFLWPALGTLAGLGAIFVAMVCFGRLPLAGKRFVYAVSYGTTAMLGYLFIGTFVLQLDLEVARGVRFDWGHLVAGLVSTAVAAGVGFLLAGLEGPDPEPERPSSSGPAPRMPLAADQRASWTRTVATRALALLTFGSTALAGVLSAALGAWAVAVATLLPGLVLLAFASVRVTVDHRGVLIGSGRFGRLRKTIPLDQIKAAGSQRVSPWRDFRGWGYRVTPHRSGLVTREGEALALELVSGREFVVTVDDSQTAAALVNALVDRR